MTIHINKGISRADAIRIVNYLVDPKKNGAQFRTEAGQFHGSQNDNSTGNVVRFYHCDDIEILSADLFRIISEQIAHGNPGEIGKVEINILL